MGDDEEVQLPLPPSTHMIDSKGAWAIRSPSSPVVDSEEACDGVRGPTSNRGNYWSLMRVRPLCTTAPMPRAMGNYSRLRGKGGG